MLGSIILGLWRVDTMDKSDLGRYWEETSDRDYITMRNLYDSGDYHWSLFMGHLVLEKLLKACYVMNVSEKVPFTHDLLRSADLAGMGVDEERADQLDLITTFNINARYPDYKQAFYRKCTLEFSARSISRIEEIRTWLKETLHR